MNFQKMLDRYMSDLQEFDLEVFFHDDTFRGEHRTVKCQRGRRATLS